MKEPDKFLDSQLWHACAGGMIQMPPVDSKVFYFPQGHAEHAQGNIDFGTNPRIPSQILCRVSDIKYMADPETDEVFAKIRLVPSLDFTDDEVHVQDVPEKLSSFAKTLTQSDANNGGGFSVPRYCAETIFPRLDYSADPPVQTVLARDVHGEQWKFRHIYRGTPRRHLLTTGWSIFVNQKKLMAGDSIVFLRAENGELRVGIRRAKRGIGGGPESSVGWNTPSGNYMPQYGGFSVLLREEENKLLRNNGSCGNVSPGSGGRAMVRVRAESVIEAARLAANGQPFEVVYYPRASTPEFCVKASSVKASNRIHWTPGMRFKMAFETEDSSRISWFMGTISGVQFSDPIRWPNSAWRILQVTWDEPDLLQNVKRVSPWLVELVSTLPAIHLSPFSPPRKKPKIPQHPDFSIDGHFPTPIFSGNPLGPGSNHPLCCLPNNTPAGIQGARHAQFGISLSDLHLNKLQSGTFPAGFHYLDHGPPNPRISTGLIMGNHSIHDNVSCLLTIGNSSPDTKKSYSDTKSSSFLLFGKTILSEKQMSMNSSGDTTSPVRTGNSSSDDNLEKTMNLSDGSCPVSQRIGPLSNTCNGFSWLNEHQIAELTLETGHCKVFMESEDVGRTLDLSVLGSYDELLGKLADMFGVEKSDMKSYVRYRDSSGAVKHAGDEPFGDFKKSARRLMILMHSSGGVNTTR